MTPLGFKFLTWMIITVSTCSGVLQTLNDEVLDYLEFLWQYTVMGKSKCTDPNTHIWNFVETVMHAKGCLGSCG